MKIAIIGSRGFKDLDFVKDVVEDTFVLYPSLDVTFVSGGSSVKDENNKETSVDKYAENVIDFLNLACPRFSEMKIKKQIFLPDWKKFGKKAGFLRNQLIIDEADKVIAFWNGKSKGTKNSIDLAIKAGKPVDIYIRN